MHPSSNNWAFYYTFPKEDPLTPIAVQWFYVRQHARNRLSKFATSWQIILVNDVFYYAVGWTIIVPWVSAVKLDGADRSGSYVSTPPMVPTHFKVFADFEVGEFHCDVSMLWS